MPVSPRFPPCKPVSLPFLPSSTEPRVLFVFFVVFLLKLWHLLHLFCCLVVSLLLAPKLHTNRPLYVCVTERPVKQHTGFSSAGLRTTAEASLNSPISSRSFCFDTAFIAFSSRDFPGVQVLFPPSHPKCIHRLSQAIYCFYGRILSCAAEKRPSGFHPFFSEIVNHPLGYLLKCSETSPEVLSGFPYRPNVLSQPLSQHLCLLSTVEPARYLRPYARPLFVIISCPQYFFEHTTENYSIVVCLYLDDIVFYH